MFTLPNTYKYTVHKQIVLTSYGKHVALIKCLKKLTLFLFGRCFRHLPLFGCLLFFLSLITKEIQVIIISWSFLTDSEGKTDFKQKRLFHEILKNVYNIIHSPKHPNFSSTKIWHQPKTESKSWWKAVFWIYDEIDQYKYDPIV